MSDQGIPDPKRNSTTEEVATVVGWILIVVGLGVWTVLNARSQVGGSYLGFSGDAPPAWTPGAWEYWTARVSLVSAALGVVVTIGRLLRNLVLLIRRRRTPDWRAPEAYQ